MPRNKQKMPKESTIRILVVDDETGPRELLRSALSDKGFFVKTAKSGEEACQLFDDNLFDLVLTDLKMPGLNGIDLLKEIKKRAPETLVILITGYSSLRSAIEAIREGAYDYLTKPFQLDELYIAIKNASDRIKLIKENNRLLDDLKQIHAKVSHEMALKHLGNPEYVTGLDLIQALREQLLQVYTRTGQP